VDFIGGEMERRSRDQKSLQLENWVRKQSLNWAQERRMKKQRNLEKKMKAGNGSTFFISTPFLW
jgi:hypothetical protein